MAPKKKASHKPKAHSEKASAKDHILYVEAEEEVTSVIDRMKHTKAHELFIVVPNRAMLLQSVVNLKLIKKEAVRLKKEINIVTTDRKGMSLASQVGLTVYHDLKSRTSTKAFEMEEISTVHQVPVAVSIPMHSEEKPRALGDYLKGVISREKLKKTSRSPDGRHAMDMTAFVAANPNRRALTLFIAVSGFLLVLIAYFILPQATVHVQAESFVEHPIERVILADAGLNEAELKINDDTTIASYPIETEIELTKAYSATGITSTGTDARGDVLIFNDSGSTQPLIQKTRIRSPEGLIFRLQRDVIVPPRSSMNVAVLADKLDEAGQVIGERGNLGPTRFTLPALTGANKELIYAKNIEPFTGGKTEAMSLVQEQDIEAAKSNIVEELKAVAKQKLQERLINENKTRDAQLALMDTDEALQVEVVEVKLVVDTKPGDLVKEFQVYGKVKVFALTYDRNDVISILDRKLRTFIHPDQEVADVDEDSLKLEFVAFDENKKTRVNASMNYRLQYDIDKELVTSIKENILGKSVQEAETYVQELEQIGEVKITTWPFWVRQIPGVAWNIQVEEESDIT